MKTLTQSGSQNRSPEHLHTCCALILLTAVTAHSQIIFDYVKVADTTMAIPNGMGNFGGFTLPANTGSNIVFYSQAGLQKGIYNSAGGVLTVIADTNTPAHGGQPGRFLMEFGTPSVRGTGVAFYGDSFSGPAIYRSSGGVLEVIADIETPVPGGTGNFGTFLAAVSASDGLVGFRGNNFAGGGLYVGDGSTVTRVADFTTPIPSGTGTFTGLIPPSVDGNMAVFRGLGSGSQQGIYQWSSGNLSRVANTNTTVPSGTGRFTAFSDPTAQGGRVAFQGSGASGQSGIYLATNGALVRVASTTTTVIPAGSGTFSALGGPSIDGEDVAFFGTRSSSSQQGIYLYTGLNGTLHKVVNESTVLDGRTISFLRIGPEGLSDSSIAFYAMFTDGTVGLWVALRNYTVFNTTNGSWDVPTNWAFGQIPGTNVPVLINPAGALTITGPAVATQIHSLIVSNSGAGTTTLQLQSNGLMTAAQGVIIGANGILAGNGGLALGSNATVEISGSVSAIAVVSPGASIGTLSLGAPGSSNRVVFGNHSELQVEINQAGQSDQLTVNGNLDLSSALDSLNISVTDSAIGDYTLVTYSGTLAGTFNTVKGLPAGYSVDYSQPGQIILKAGQADTDSDGIPDAFELQYATNLTVLSATGDVDGDRQTDLGEYIADTNPVDPASRLEITGSSFSLVLSNRHVTLTWRSSLLCRYRIEETGALGDPWQIALDNIEPDNGSATTRTLVRPVAPGWFFRVCASRSAGQ